MTEVWQDSQHAYRSLVEGPKHTNSQDATYRAMFLVRNCGGNDPQSDIVTFRVSPQQGIGWVTAPDTFVKPDGTIGHTKLTIERLSPSHDPQGNYWFGYIAPGAAGNVYGLGFFEPPEGDPLDQP